MKIFYSVDLDCGHTATILVSGTPRPDASFGVQCPVPGCEASRLALYRASILAPAGPAPPREPVQI